MAEKRSVALLGRLAIHLKMIAVDQLAVASAEQRRSGGEKNLGEIFLELGFIDRSQFAKLVAAHRQVLAKQLTQGAQSAKAGARPAPTAEAAAVGGRATATEEGAAAGGRAASAQADSAGRRAAPSAKRAPARPSAKRPPGAPELELQAKRPPEPQPEPQSEPAQSAPVSAASDPTPASGAVVVSSARIGDALVTAGEEDRQALESLLRQAVERGASDVHIHAGAPVAMRICGALDRIGAPLDAESAERLVVCALRPEELAILTERGEIDVCHAIKGVGRFRANLYRQQRGVDGVFRSISAQPPTLEELGLPAELAKLTNYHQGMVLVTGPTGCGKSSTLAALVNLVNEDRTEHILTIEDPIEYLHPSKRCLVNQRSVNLHTESFARALRAALREDPDVIVIGELRDLETISLALTAAETGHFVLATLHTDNAIRTVNRVVGAYPADQQDQIRSMLSVSLRAVVSQRLLPRADGTGRVPAVETLVVTKAVGNLIRENKTFQIQSILQTGASQGMRLLDHSIRAHVESGAVSREEAARHVEDERTLAA